MNIHAEEVGTESYVTVPLSKFEEGVKAKNTLDLIAKYLNEARFVSGEEVKILINAYVQPNDKCKSAE